MEIKSENVNVFTMAYEQIVWMKIVGHTVIKLIFCKRDNREHTCNVSAPYAYTYGNNDEARDHDGPCYYFWYDQVSAGIDAHYLQRIYLLAEAHVSKFGRDFLSLLHQPERYSILWEKTQARKNRAHQRANH